MSAVCFRLRILTVHITYILYSVLLWWKLVEIGYQTGHAKNETTIAMVVWLTVYVVANAFLCFSGISGRPMKILLLTWCNLPMLTFIGFNLPPYGFTLKHLYEATENRIIFHQEAANHTCIEPVHIPTIDFVLLQMVMPVLLATFIIYPLPQRGFTPSEYLAIAVEFMNAFDIMDMVSDVGYVQKYGLFWNVVFYVSLGVSALLVAFPIKIEQDDFIWPRRIIICSHSELSLKAGENLPTSMSSILTAPYVIETEHAVHKRISIAPSCVDKEKEQPDKKTIKELSLQQVTESQKEELNAAVQKDSEEQNTSADDSVDRETYRKIIKVLLTVVFMDVSFASIRCKIMFSENSVDYGFNMFVKNVILSGLHLSYLLQHMKTLLISKLDRSS